MSKVAIKPSAVVRNDESADEVTSVLAASTRSSVEYQVRLGRRLINRDIKILEALANK